MSRRTVIHVKLPVETSKSSGQHEQAAQPPPPPPPPPPPLPGTGGTQHEPTTSNLNIDLVNPIGHIKPNAKMRTLNWRRIPKQRILSQEVKPARSIIRRDDSPKSGERNVGSSSESESDCENKNIWFLIAKDNKCLKKLSTREHSGQAATVAANGKSASRIKEMLESVRRRMAAMTAAAAASSSDKLGQVGDGSLYDLPTSCGGQVDWQPKSLLEAIDYHDLESLFCLNNQPFDCLDETASNFVRRLSLRTNASTSGDSLISSSSYLNDESGRADDLDNGAENEDDEDSFLELISENILDSKKSLNVNIFLKQLKHPDELIELLNNNENHSKVGKDKLENLLRLLPDENEHSKLMKFSSRKRQSRLPVAERFLLQLVTRIQNPLLRIKFMLLQEKYYTDLVPSVAELDKIELAASELKQSKKFRDILNLVLVTGNFLNAGAAYAADAAGFALDCLEHLHEVKSNRQGIFLIHFVAEIALKMNLIDFQRDELASVELASKVCVDSIQADLIETSEKINELKSDSDKEVDRLRSDRVCPEEEQASKEFLMNLLRTLEDIKCNVDFFKQRLRVGLETTRKDLANYLCEEPETFKLSDCFNTVLAFSQRLRLAAEENARRIKYEASKQSIKNSSSLRRSNTINPRHPKAVGQTSGSRNSFGGGGASQQLGLAQASRVRASLGGGNEASRFASSLTRTGSICSASKSSLSSLSSQATSSTSTSGTKAAHDHDDLHDGLMKLLIAPQSLKTIQRRYSDSRGLIGDGSGRSRTSAAASFRRVSVQSSCQ